MFFDDDKKSKKVNKADKKITTRTEFIENLKNHKTKEDKSNQKENSFKIIISRFNSIKERLCEVSYLKAKLSNLLSVANLLKIKENLSLSQKEQIVEVSINKLQNDIQKILKCFNINSLPDGIIFTDTLIDLVMVLSKNKADSIFKNNSIMIVLLLKTLIIRLFNEITIKKNLLDQFNELNIKISFILSILSSILDNNKEYLDLFSKNLNFLYILNGVLKCLDRVIDTKFKENFILFCFLISKNMTTNYNILKFNFLRELLNKSIDYVNSSKNSNIIQKVIFISGIICDYNSLESLKASNLIDILTNSQFINNSIRLYSSIFQALYLKDLAYLDSNKEIKHLLIQKIFTIIESCLKLESHIKYKIYFISTALKLFKTLYSYDIEHVSNYQILDYIFNKSSSSTSTILYLILLYSIEIYFNKQSNSNRIIKEEKDYDILEIITFALDQKLQFNISTYIPTANDLQKKSITENVPFNFIYLRAITKLVLKVYIQLSTSNQESNIISHCLKTLFNYDNEVDFSYNETFWQDYELNVKVVSFDKVRKMEIISEMPFIYPLKLRITTFYENMKVYPNKKLLIYAMNNDIQVLDIKVSRSSLFENTFSLYLNNQLTHKLPWKITFINKLGQIEDGQDAGGLFLEFLNKLSEEAFCSKTGFFVETANGFLAPNPHSDKISQYHLKIYEFLGFIVGLSIVNEVNIWPNFSTFFLNNILNFENSFVELKAYDSELYKNLITLQDYNGNIEEDFGLNFTIVERTENKIISEKELIQNGKNIQVNNQNKLLYIRKVAQFKLETQFKSQTDAFRTGLQSIFSEESYQVFTSNELRQIIAGFDKEINVSEWIQCTVYSYFEKNNKTHTQAINNFWEIVWEMENKEREKLLFFVTSLKRPPLTGFKSLSPLFTLSLSDKTFPTSSTCVNQLKLPILPKEEMKKTLLYAINADSGFYFA